MYKGQRFLAVIPARGGSKGIPNKNIIEINGRPLIDYTISEAKKSQYIDEIFVSTDSSDIASVSKKCGLEVPFLRSNDLAQDDTNTIDVLIEVINELKFRNQRFDYVVLLQPTQPLRNAQHIDDAIKIIVDSEYDSLVSVNEVNEHPILMRTINPDGSLNNILKEGSTVRRQDFTKIFKVNGSIYINKIDANFNKSTSLNDNKFAFIMDKKFDLDIDEPEDLKKFKRVIANH